MIRRVGSQLGREATMGLRGDLTTTFTEMQMRIHDAAGSTSKITALEEAVRELQTVVIRLAGEIETLQAPSE